VGPAQWNTSSISSLEVWFGPGPINLPDYAYQNVILNSIEQSVGEPPLQSILFRTFSAGEQTDDVLVEGKWMPAHKIWVSTGRGQPAPPGNTYGS
jgi:hypothetical protein